MTIEPDHIENVYFLGIGGIGMSALARYFSSTGKQVAGYDRTPTDITNTLISEGISIHFQDSPEMIPAAFKSNDNTLVVYTPAIPAEHGELVFFRQNNYKIFKRSQILGFLTKNYKTIAVAGTHGKTTVSTMIAYILSLTDDGCNAFLGGISKNIGSNLLLSQASNLAVTEADEYDRSFLQLSPYAAIVTAMDADHLDIYGSHAAMTDAFNQFVSQINCGGILLIKEGLPIEAGNLPRNVYTYSLEGNSDFRAVNIRLQHNRYHFDLAGPDILIENIILMHPGLINVENAVAASSMAVLMGAGDKYIKEALGSFSGIQRRFDFQISTAELVYIDDYAHHPKEIEATLRSLRELYPGKSITGIFQPHLYTRTRDFADGFADSLNMLDRLIMLDIYPAREKPIKGISSAIIFDKVTVKDKILCKKDELLDIISQYRLEILVTLGAGDIDQFVEPIKQLLTHSGKK